MPARPTKTQRLLDLVALLLGRKIPLTVQEIFERVPAYAAAVAKSGDTSPQSSVRRMFERDKKELLEAGVPLEAVDYDINYGAEQLQGYRIQHGDFYLPYLRVFSEGRVEAPSTGRKPYSGLKTLDLTPAEAERAIDALRHVAELPAFPFADEAASALRKLTFDVDVDRFPDDPVRWVERPGAAEVLEHLRVLSDALLSRKRVRFTYHGIYRGEATEREVAPYGLFFQRDWYLVGHDATRDGRRVFRVARMEGLEPNPKAPGRPDYEIPPDFHLRDHLDRSAWELGDDDLAVAAVRFRFPLSLWAARNDEGELVEEGTDGSAVRRFRVSQANPFLRWILSLGGEAEILSPPELHSQLQAMAGEVTALYETEVALHG